MRDPALDFIVDFADRLRRLSPHFVADARTTGGSLMRPYRDVRFSPDRTPYKTNVAIRFRHEAGQDVPAPGFYLHLEPGSCFAGVGLWRPETAVARVLRQAIHDDAEGWSVATKAAGFRADWSLDHDDAEMLKRVPAGFDPEHPHADDLRMRSFVARAMLSQKQVTTAGFDQTLAVTYQKASGFTRFLCEALDLSF